MKERASGQKAPSSAVQGSNLGATGGAKGVALAPPTAGIGEFDQQPLQLMADVQTPNRTGLPDQLKAGVERLSGLAMDDVRVHYNSAKPAQLQAFAYTQGTEIHVAPGQERYLPHEAWHVVQQAQGRVKPTMQLQNGVPVNDDKGLEREADVMGAHALVHDQWIRKEAPHDSVSTAQSNFGSGQLTTEAPHVEGLGPSDPLAFPHHPFSHLDDDTHSSGPVGTPIVQLYRQNINPPPGVKGKKVRATVNAAVGALAAPPETSLVWNTATGAIPLHQTKKWIWNGKKFTKGAPPPGVQGYIHAPLNQLLAVTRLDVARHTIEIDRRGHVNAGWHVF